MGDGSLSQEEIDLLLQGADNFGGAAQGGSGDGGAEAELSAEIKRAAASILLHALQSGLPSFSSLLSREVRLGEPFIELKSCEELKSEYSANFAIYTQAVQGGLNGNIGLVVPGGDAARISALVMGSTDVSAMGSTLDSAQIATLKDVLGPLMSSAITQLSVKIGAAVNAMPADVYFTTPQTPFPVKEDSACLRASFPLKIEGVLESRIHFLTSAQVVKELISRAQSGAQMAVSPGGGGRPSFGSGIGNAGSMGIKGVEFPTMNIAGLGQQNPNVNLLMDVQMTLTVELGRTKMYIKEILSLGEGSIIELDKLAGEPVDLLVNGKLIAKGEVVVIDENFGVRVTDIVSPVDRLKSQKQNG